jgi:hypothetical protein
MRVPTAKIPIPSMISLNSSNSLMKILNSCRNLSPSQMTHIFIIFLPFFRFFFALIARHRFAMFIYCVILIWYIFSKKSSNFFVNLMRWLNQIQSTIIIFILYLFSTHFNLVVLKIVWGDLNEIGSEFFLLFFHVFIQFLFFPFAKAIGEPNQEVQDARREWQKNPWDLPSSEAHFAECFFLILLRPLFSFNHGQMHENKTPFCVWCKYGHNRS